MDTWDLSAITAVIYALKEKRSDCNPAHQRIERQLPDVEISPGYDRNGSGTADHLDRKESFAYRHPASSVE
jgi:hypothetical protein